MDSLTRWTEASPLPLLGPHLPTLILSTISFFSIQYVSHRLSPIWLGSKWDSFDKRTRKGWASHVVCKLVPSWKARSQAEMVAMVHALVIVPLAARSLQSDVLSRDPVFGYDPMVGHVLALSSG